MQYLTTGLAAAALLVLAGCDQASEDVATEGVAEPIAATEDETATEGMMEEAAIAVEEQTGDLLNELETAAGGMTDGMAGDLMDQAEGAAKEVEEVVEEAVEEKGGE
jgi:uncharacterized protein YjbJ (UPF0337 family)